MSIRKVGKLTQKVINLLGLELEVDKPIFIGDENIKKMKVKHSQDFKKYGSDLESIIAEPDYMALHPHNKSIQYIKVYRREEDYVLVAVRASGSGVLFVRTLFIMAEEKIFKYWLKNIFKAY